MAKRRSKRILKRLEINFFSGDISHKGIAGNFSEEGIYVRTRKGLPPGTILELELYLPSGETIKLRGKVKWAVRASPLEIKNGMGIELIDIPPKYTEFLKTL